MTDLTALLQNGWTKTSDGTAIEKHFKFKSFAQAWGFMSQAALAAERINHHPEWINVYNRVNVRLTTHDTGGISELDVQLANKMEALIASS